MRPTLRAAFSVLMGMLAADPWGPAAGVVVALAFFTAVSIWSLLANAGERDSDARRTRLITDMLSVADMTSRQASLVPGALLERMKETSSQGAVWPTGLWALVLKANDRCPWYLGTKDSVHSDP